LRQKKLNFQQYFLSLLRSKNQGQFGKRKNGRADTLAEKNARQKKIFFGAGQEPPQGENNGI
jgi:hypothetical protein